MKTDMQKVIDRINHLKAELKAVSAKRSALLDERIKLNIWTEKEDLRILTEQAAELRARLLSAYDVFFLYTVAWDNKKLKKD
jgi:hypothetical protein